MAKVVSAPRPGARPDDGFSARLFFAISRRMLDVAKPGPIGWADRQGGAAGIIADDVIAGAIAAGILWAIQAHWPGAFAPSVRLASL